MTPVPPPASPCVRVALKYLENDGYEGGSRFYLSYTGSAPSGANCTTLAGDIASQWAGGLEGAVNVQWALVEVDVLDIATNTGHSGQWTGTNTGTNAGTPLPAQCATNVEFNIARRYRGGKPRMYLPPGVTGNQVNAGHYTSAFIGVVNAGMAGFMTGIEALTIGSMGTLAHVNLSYYSGFTNHTNPSGRSRAVPTYRAAALLDTVTGYSTKSLIGSQRRRRQSTSF